MILERRSLNHRACRARHRPSGRRTVAATAPELRFETGEQGGDYSDNMPQAITVTDAQGRWAVYVPLRVGGKIVVPDQVVPLRPVAHLEPFARVGHHAYGLVALVLDDKLGAGLKHAGYRHLYGRIARGTYFMPAPM
jgi:hypothetical protein